MQKVGDHSREHWEHVVSPYTRQNVEKFLVVSSLYIHAAISSLPISYMLNQGKIMDFSLSGLYSKSKHQVPCAFGLPLCLQGHSYECISPRGLSLGLCRSGGIWEVREQSSSQQIQCPLLHFQLSFSPNPCINYTVPEDCFHHQTLV